MGRKTTRPVFERVPFDLSYTLFFSKHEEAKKEKLKVKKGEISEKALRKKNDETTRHTFLIQIQRFRVIKFEWDGESCFEELFT